MSEDMVYEGGPVFDRPRAVNLEQGEWFAISVSELRYKLHAILDRVEAGESFVVTRYKKVVAVLVPYAGNEDAG